MSHSLIRGAPGHLERGRVRIKLPAAAAAEMIHSLKFFFRPPFLFNAFNQLFSPPPSIYYDLKDRDSSHIFHDDAEGGDSACCAGWRARAPRG